MNAIAGAFAFAVAMAAGTFLVMNQHATIGGWVMILSLVAVSWGSSEAKKK